MEEFHYYNQLLHYLAYLAKNYYSYINFLNYEKKLMINILKLISV